MRVLAIDPEKRIENCLITGLSQEGFLVDRAVNWQKALWLSRSTTYDLILLYLFSDKRFFKEIKKLVEASPSTFLIVLASKISLEEKIALFEIGVDEISSCFSSKRELILKMHNLLRWEKNVSVNQNSFQLGGLKLDPSRFLVYRGNREIILRRKEFDLLYFLFRNQDRVLTKVKILENVWDSNSDVLTNTLEVHILNLRRKIDKGVAYEQRLIHTIYGRGYLFGLRPSFSGEIPATIPLSTN